MIAGGLPPPPPLLPFLLLFGKKTSCRWYWLSYCDKFLLCNPPHPPIPHFLIIRFFSRELSVFSSFICQISHRAITNTTVHMFQDWSFKTCCGCFIWVWFLAAPRGTACECRRIWTQVDGNWCVSSAAYWAEWGMFIHATFIIFQHLGASDLKLVFSAVSIFTIMCYVVTVERKFETDFNT